MARKTHTEAQMRYDKVNRRVYGFRLHNIIDADIIARLAEVDSMQGYIKDLIREDIKRQSAPVPVPESAPILRRENKTMTKIEAVKKLTDNGLFTLADDIISSINEHKTGENKSVYQHLAYLVGIIADMKNWAMFSAKGMLDYSTRLYGFAQGLSYAEINVIDSDTYDSIEELYNIVFENCIPIIEGKHESEPDPYYEDPNL